MQADSPGRLRSEAFLTLQKCRAEKCAGAGNSHWVAGAAGRDPAAPVCCLCEESSHLTTGVVDPLVTGKCFAPVLRTSLPCHERDRILSALALQAEG